VSVLTGALTAAEVTDVPDDAAALRSAARAFANAADGIHSAATRGSGVWSGIPTVFQADALTPALTPLMDPAVQQAQHLRTAADDFLRVASAAANSIDDLHRDRDVLVRQIDRFHASAPGQVEAHAAQEVSKGNLLGAVATVITSWQQVPALVAEEASLRIRVRNHNDNVATTLNGIAAQLDQITPANVDAGTVHLASTTKHSDSGNWFTHAWGDVEGVAKGAWGGVEHAAESAWPSVQDVAGVAGNVFASLGNAMLEHPDETLELLGGIATMMGGAAMEGGGIALDFTGIGAIGGVPLNISGAAVMAAGAATATAGAGQLATHALTDDAKTPYDTDHAARARERNEPNENHPGRNKAGEYQSKDNDKARVDSAQKEAEGIKQYSKQNGGVHVDTDKVLAKQPGVEKGRFYDGLVKKPDGTYEGIEVKSGSSKDAAQERFDAGVSYDDPAYATLRNGDRIKITSVDYQYVK
jgi:hypothetical protein